MGPDLMNLSKSEFVTRVMFGMAGVIYLDDHQDRRARDESWLHRGFATTPDTTRCEWHSDRMVVATYHHAGEAWTTPGTFNCEMPMIGRLQGVVCGHFFELNGAEQRIADVSRKTLREFDAKGNSCFAQMNGSFSCVVWDEDQKAAHFVRDTTGVQVLYVSHEGDRIVFASDLRIFQASGMLDAVDEQSVAEFLHYLYVPAPRSLAKNCQAVLPGHVLTIGATTRQARYCADRYVSGQRLATPGAVDREMERQLPVFEGKLLAAVADCLPKTGRIALTLSGGKDSSALAIALSKLCPERVLALTVGQSDERINETSDAERVCHALGLAHYSYTPTDAQLARGIGTFAGIQDQVTGDPAAIPYFLGMCSLPDDCTVILDGTGSDFYFGMPTWQKGVWHYQRRTQFQKWMPGFAWPLFLGLLSMGPTGARRLSRLWVRPVEESFVPWDAWSAAELEELTGRDVSFSDTYLWQVMRGADPKQWLAVYTEVFGRVWEPNTSYRKALDSAHATGRGLRLPFVDNRLAAYVNELPEQLKHVNGVNKQLVRAYLRANLPREVVEKPKRGFIFDLNRLLANPDLKWAHELRRADLFRLLPNWSQEPVDELLRKYAQEPNDPRWQQRLYALCLLVTVFAVKNGYDWHQSGYGR